MKRLAIALAAMLLLAFAGSALATGTLSGKYKTVIKNDTALGGALNGTWVLKAKGGKYSATDNGNVVVKGNYTIKGNVITLKDTGGPAQCPATGKYSFKLKNGGKKVTFKKISDSSSSKCIGRQDVLVGHTFTKV
jgi:hypothetical protein